MHIPHRGSEGRGSGWPAHQLLKRSSGFRGGQAPGNLTYRLDNAGTGGVIAARRETAQFLRIEPRGYGRRFRERTSVSLALQPAQHPAIGGLSLRFLEAMTFLSIFKKRNPLG